MYIHGDMTTAKFAVIERPRTYQFVGRWTDYTERFGYAKVFEVTRNFIEKISWMTEDHSYVVHFCQNGIEDVCDDTRDIETDGKSLLFAYDVLQATRGEKSYTTEELIDYANNHYDYRYEDDNIYGFGAKDITVDDVDKGLAAMHLLAIRTIDRKTVYAEALANYQQNIEENHRREERDLKKARRERESAEETEREKRERAEREYKEREQRERAEREERARREREQIQREQEERERREREERELAQRKETLQTMRNDVYQWVLDVANQMYEKQIDVKYDAPFVQFGRDQTDTVENIIQTYFKTKFYDVVTSRKGYYVPKALYNKYAQTPSNHDVCVAQTTVLNLTTIPIGVVVDGIVNLFQLFDETMWMKPHENVDDLRSIINHNQHYVFHYKPSAKLQLSDRGIELHLGLTPHGWTLRKPDVGIWVGDIKPHHAFEWCLFDGWQQRQLTYAPETTDYELSSKTKVAERIREWKQTHKHVIDRVRHNEDAWWRVERLPFVNPKPNTNLLYVAYLPHTDVIKVGRTQNWESRENAYRRISGPTPETTGDMRLCYVYETPTVGDVAIDKWLLYCAEDHIKQFARERMELVGGNEFFRGQPVQEFCITVDEYFKTLTMQDIINIRPDYEAKQFALQNNYHVERFLDALEQL